ncbi:MAG: hypothetical protein IK129_05590 [Deltaproteobacteria bacterium]|nr:hypothetical protein [Deltaproteobacteria bacterium]
MLPQVEELIKLQAIDNEILEIKTLRARLQTEERELFAGLDELQSEVARLQAELGDAGKVIQDLQVVLADGQEKIVKAEKRLLEVHTVKEQNAVTKERETAKQANREAQERIRELENGNVQLQEEKTEKEQAIAEIQERAGARSAEIAPQIAQFDQQLEEKQQSRAVLLDKLPAPLRRRYEQLIELRNGSAVVAARACACTGCHMRLPPQFFNSLYHSTELNSCPHCNRILYLDASEPAKKS